MPQPFGQEKLETIAFNQEITDATFVRDYHLQSSLFMHAYHYIDDKSIAAFKEVAVADKWLAVQHNIFYAMLHKSVRQYGISNIDKIAAEVAEDFEQLRSYCQALNLFLGIDEPLEE